MKVLHFHIKSDVKVRQYVDVLAMQQFDNVEIKTCSDLRSFKKELSEWRPDIVHLHGCWHTSVALAGALARKNKARVVLTPHGQLEPWVLKQRHWSEKMPKMLIYQHRCICKAYAIVAQGRMEAGYIKQSRRNDRVETVLNSLITAAISDREMAEQMIGIYNKVLDSDVYELMSIQARQTLRAIIKAGICGDARWLTADERTACSDLGTIEWHKIAVYARQENIYETIQKGTTALNLAMPSPLHEASDCYTPPAEETIMPLTANLSDHGGMDAASAIEAARKRFKTGKLRLYNLIEISSMLRHGSLNEERLAEQLRQQKLLKFASRLMSILADTTGLDEGFMPLPPKPGRTTTKIENKITKRIKI